MIATTSRALHYGLGAVLAAVTLTSPAPAQDARTQLRAGVLAWEQEIDAARALPLLVRGLDPAGPRDSLWSLGAQYLVDLLWEEQEAQARVWARWVVEAHPGIALNALLVRSAVIEVIESERRSVAAEPAGVVQTSWIWPAGTLAGPGAVEVRAAPTVRLAVVGQAALASGERLSVPPGVYQVRAEASGFAPAVVSRAALPGVVTVVGFQLRPAAVVARRDTSAAGRAQPEAAKDTTRQVPAARAGKKKGFPWAIAAIGAAGAGAAAFFLLKPKATTDGSQTVSVPIIVTIP